MTNYRLVLSLALIIGLVSACANAAVAPQMEAFRKGIPAPRNLGEANGLGFADINGTYYTLSNLSGVAQRMRVDGKPDLIVLMSYLNDADRKIRFIAATALEQRLHVFPNGMTSSDLSDIGSKGHARMVELFAKKLAEQTPTGNTPAVAP